VCWNGSVQLFQTPTILTIRKNDHALHWPSHDRTYSIQDHPTAAGGHPYMYAVQSGERRYKCVVSCEIVSVTQTGRRWQRDLVALNASGGSGRWWRCRLLL
jgi:hypothetical protein